MKLKASVSVAVQPSVARFVEQRRVWSPDAPSHGFVSLAPSSVLLELGQNAWDLVLGHIGLEVSAARFERLRMDHESADRSRG